MPRRLDKPTVIASATLALAILVTYARALTRYFTSEDFLLLRFLREHPPWRSPSEFLSSPWLGISVVKFYRPVATLMLAIEVRLFGAHPVPYNALHLAVHFLNAVLVWRISRRVAGALEPAWTPLAIALLFALYPLHPNAVSFIASFATLFSTTFLLIAIDAYQRGADVPALVAFLLALGSYEAAVTLPALLIAHDALLPSVRGSEPHEGWRQRLRRWAPFGVSVAAYLLLRRAVLGVTVGGYEDAGRRLWHSSSSPGSGLLSRSGGCTFNVRRVLRNRGIDDRGLSWPLRGLLLRSKRTPMLVADRADLDRAGAVAFSFRACRTGDGRYWYFAVGRR